MLTTPPFLFVCLFVCLLFFRHRQLTGITANDGKWHHICFSWSNSYGSWQFFKDGTLAKNGTDLGYGYTIKGGAKLVIGQDTLGGGFSAELSFQGFLTSVNVWSSVRRSEIIKEMSKPCLRGEGNVYRWSDFRYTARGNPKVVIPSPCVPQQEWRRFCKHTVFKPYGRYELWINIVRELKWVSKVKLS